MRVLVTGAAGFIGSHLSEALLARGDEVVGVDCFNDFYDPAIKEKNAARLLKHSTFQLVRGTLLDLATRQACFEQPIDVVMHLAAWAGVRPSIEQPALYQRENIEVLVGLMDTMRGADGALPGAGAASGRQPKLVFASSSSVYGANKKVPFHEDDSVDHPVSPYAATKKCGELLAYSYHHLFALDVTCLRFFTVYGPRQRPEMAIHKFARLLLDGKSIPMYGDGSSARDYTFVDDIVSGVVAAIDRCAGYHIYNLGNSDTVTLAELIAKLGRVLKVEPKIEQLPDQPGDVPITFSDISRARSELDFVPTTSIDEGLEKFAAWLREQDA